MSSADPELSRLLLHELGRHLIALEADPHETAAAQRAIHALKGSAGLAGEGELSAALERIERRAKRGDRSAFDEAAAIVRTAVERLAAGQSAIVTRWPTPPDDLVARPLDPTVRAQYAAEMMDRLARIDEALSLDGDASGALHEVYRHVHTMKGAASAVGDEPMTWFCHGLEDELRPGEPPDGARSVLQQMGRWRVLLAGLLDDPEAALATLRRRSGSLQVALPPRPSTSTVVSGSDPARAPEESAATIRVAAVEVDGLLERFDAVDLVREGIASHAQSTHGSALRLRSGRRSLVEALRLIGPPRPWGAPAAALRRVEEVAAALGAAADDIESTSARLHESEHALRDGVVQAKKQLLTMRQTAVGRIFARLTTAIESEARRIGRAVIVRTRGADETIDRRLAEQLAEVGLQLVRNAVAHGIEPPDVRTAVGKPASGTIALSAKRRGNRLSITIEDDGAGVDVAGVRARAVDAGLVTAAIAAAADDDTLLSLLFVPGFSTRDSSDLLAGRGIGLDIARSVTQRLGGALRLSSRAGKGFCARIEVALESGLVNVLWVLAGRDEFALPAANALRARRNDGADAMRVPHLMACLDATASAPAPYAVDLQLNEDGTAASAIAIGVDAVGHCEEVLVRPLGPLVAGVGPFAGAILRGDGSLRFAVDPWAIAPRALAVMAAARSSSRPPSRDDL
ncbi:MAG: Hpt domain-containing protein [Myxococcota bacterium]|nr:Hpt domain-containing protein [Myxococcota bacterium]